MSYIFPKIYAKVSTKLCIFARYGRYQKVIGGKHKFYGILWKMYFKRKFDAKALYKTMMKK